MVDCKYCKNNTPIKLRTRRTYVSRIHFQTLGVGRIEPLTGHAASAAYFSEILFSITLKLVLLFFSNAKCIIIIQIKAYLFKMPPFQNANGTLLNKTSVRDFDDMLFLKCLHSTWGLRFFSIMYKKSLWFIKIKLNLKSEILLLLWIC